MTLYYYYPIMSRITILINLKFFQDFSFSVFALLPKANSLIITNVTGAPAAVASTVAQN